MNTNYTLERTFFKYPSTGFDKIVINWKDTIACYKKKGFKNNLEHFGVNQSSIIDIFKKYQFDQLMLYCFFYFQNFQFEALISSDCREIKHFVSEIIRLKR